MDVKENSMATVKRVQSLQTRVRLKQGKQHENKGLCMECNGKQSERLFPSKALIKLSNTETFCN